MRSLPAVEASILTSGNYPLAIGVENKEIQADFSYSRAVDAWVRYYSSQRWVSGRLRTLIFVHFTCYCLLICKRSLEIVEYFA